MRRSTASRSAPRPCRCGRTRAISARTPAEIAAQLADGKKNADIAGAVDFTTPGGNTVKSVFLTPVAITKDNLNVVIDAGWISKEAACAGVAAGSVAACN